MSLHPTRKKLTETWLQLSDEVGQENVTVDDLLKRSGVSKGSLYYHFVDYDDLIAAALAERYAEGVDRSVSQCDALLQRCATREDFLAGIRLLVEQTSGPKTAHFRLARAQIIGMCASNAALRTRIADEQRRMSGTIEAMLAEAQARSWLRPDLNVAAAALLVQAYTFGKVIDDIALEPIDETAWLDLISDLFESFLAR